MAEPCGTPQVTPNKPEETPDETNCFLSYPT